MATSPLQLDPMALEVETFETDGPAGQLFAPEPAPTYASCLDETCTTTTTAITGPMHCG